MHQPPARLHGIDLKARRVAAVGEGEIDGQPVTLLKPRTFVNNSGHAVGPALRHAHIPVDHLIVLYDELDLPAGRVRISRKADTAVTTAFAPSSEPSVATNSSRIRIGIGRPHVDGEPSWDSDARLLYVLGDPSPSEVEALRNAVSNAAKAVEMIVAEGARDAAMNRFKQVDIRPINPLC